MSMCKASATLSLLLGLAAVGGCESVFDYSGDSAATSSHPGSDATRNGAESGRDEVMAYLSFMEVLDSADEAGWQTVFQHAVTEFQEDPTRQPRMRLALVMSRADRRQSESRETGNMLTDARKLFDDTLYDPNPAPPMVRRFVQLQLSEIDRRLALYAELRSLRSQLAKAHQASQTANRDRTEAQARLRRIDAALSEANAKLEAVMNIERNIGPTGKETFP